MVKHIKRVDFFCTWHNRAAGDCKSTTAASEGTRRSSSGKVEITLVMGPLEGEWRGYFMRVK